MMLQRAVRFVVSALSGIISSVVNSHALQSLHLSSPSSSSSPAAAAAAAASVESSAARHVSGPGHRQWSVLAPRAGARLWRAGRGAAAAWQRRVDRGPWARRHGHRHDDPADAWTDRRTNWTSIVQRRLTCSRKLINYYSRILQFVVEWPDVRIFFHHGSFLC